VNCKPRITAVPSRSRPGGLIAENGDEPELNSIQMSHPESHAVAQAHGSAIYTHPNDVTSDPKLTTAEKRAILASWISDARRVENAPSLRRLESGALVEVDAIMQALVLLDQAAPNRRGDFKRPPSRRRRSVMSKWLGWARPRTGTNDNDDDPSPAPAGFGIPFRPKPLSPTHAARLERARELACATG
jgi:hypothetical protein